MIDPKLEHAGVLEIEQRLLEAWRSPEASPALALLEEVDGEIQRLESSDTVRLATVSRAIRLSRLYYASRSDGWKEDDHTFLDTATSDPLTDSIRLLLLAVISFNASDNTQARTQIEAARAEVTRIDSTPWRSDLECEVLNESGRIAAAIGDLEFAQAEFVRCMWASSRAQLGEVASMARINLANVKAELGDAAESVKLYRECLAYDRAHRHVRSTAITLLNLGIQLNEMAAHDAALESQREAIELLESRADREPVLEAHARYLLSRTLQLLGRSSDAQSETGLALSLITSADDPPTECRVRIQEIDLLRTSADPTRLNERIAELDALLTRIEEPRILGEAALVRAQVAHARAMSHDASLLAERALQIFRDSHSERMVQETLRELSRFREASGNPQGALDALREALELDAKLAGRQQRADLELQRLRHELDQARERERESRAVHRQLRDEAAAREEALSNADALIQRSEEQRVSLERQLRLAQKLESAGLLANGLAHDFNNLLLVIRGYASLLEGDACNPDAVRTIVEATDQAAELTRQLLSFARPQSTILESVHVGEHLNHLRALAAPLLGRTIQLQLSAEEDLPEIQVDAGQLDQVLINLIINARDAIPESGVISLEAESQEIVDDPVLPDGRCLVLRVTDNGSGIEPDALERIFEPFFSTKSRGRGTGLGLPTAFGIVRSFSGDLRVRSERGVGSTFEVFLPIVSSERARVGAATAQREGRSVLLVDDEPNARKLIQQVLESLEHSVVGASSAEQALDLITKPGADYELVITDIDMPGMDGHELDRAIRENYPQVKVLLCSGSRPPAADTDRFLQKPFTAEALDSAIQACFE